jgi:alkylated DNA repair dioxygenase AlkB
MCAHADGQPSLSFVANGKRYSCRLTTNPPARPPVVVTPSSFGISIGLPGIDGNIDRSAGDVCALHAELDARGVRTLPDAPTGLSGWQLDAPTELGGWQPDASAVQRYLNALLSMPEATPVLQRFLRLETCKETVHKPSKSKPLLMIGGVAYAEDGSAHRAEVAVLVHLPDTPCPQPVAYVRWSSDSGWTYPTYAQEQGQVAQSATLHWRDELLRVRLTSCYQEAWRKSKLPKRKAFLLQPGCVLFRNALDPSAQQALADRCLELGQGDAGFYTPTYEAAGAHGGDAAMRLQMLCLGHHWDHRAHVYNTVRSGVDGKPVPALPKDLALMAAAVARDATAAAAAVEAAAAAAAAEVDAAAAEMAKVKVGAECPVEGVHAPAAEVTHPTRGPSDDNGSHGDKPSEAERAQGSGSDGEPADEGGCAEGGCAEGGCAEAYRPDIAVVNMYGRGSTLGLHQDRDESAPRLEEGSPIVSVSVGDTCVFVVGPPTADLGGAPPPPSRCQFVRLYSGDMLVFWGASRLMWHGVKAVMPGTAPKYLKLPQRPCRLNLTFRCL